MTTVKATIAVARPGSKGTIAFVEETGWDASLTDDTEMLIVALLVLLPTSTFVALAHRMEAHAKTIERASERIEAP